MPGPMRKRTIVILPKMFLNLGDRERVLKCRGVLLAMATGKGPDALASGPQFLDVAKH